jgi:hypothetical protein
VSELGEERRFDEPDEKRFVRSLNIFAAKASTNVGHRNLRNGRIMHLRMQDDQIGTKIMELALSPG